MTISSNQIIIDASSSLTSGSVFSTSTTFKHTVKAFLTNCPKVKALSEKFEVTFKNTCFLVRKNTNTLSFSSSLGEKKEMSVDLYTWGNPNGNNLSFCGAITYALVGPATSYVSVSPSGQIIIYSITGSDVSTFPKQNNIKAYPANLVGADKIDVNSE
jgi:hypothetical protein